MTFLLPPGIKGLTIYFIVFDFIILSLILILNSNPNNLIEILSIRLFLVDCLANWLYDCLMCLNISLITLKTWTHSLLGSIVINSQSGSCSIAFYLFISRSIFLSLWPFSSITITTYSHENINQSYNLTHYIMFACFLHQMIFLFLSALIVFWLRWHHIVWILILF